MNQVLPWQRAPDAACRQRPPDAACRQRPMFEES
jgi:hypothetical protein